MASLYDQLGVAKDATEATIRKAYRKAAKSAHPDAGGSAEEFATLTTAVMVLTDPERRKKYDATGEIDGSVFNLDQEALSLATQAIMAAVAQGLDPRFSNLLGTARATLEAKKRELDAARGQIAQGVKQLETAAKRFAKKAKAVEPDWIAGIFAGQVANLKSQDEGFGRNLGVVARAKELLAAYEYVLDAREPDPSASFFLQSQMDQVTRILREGR